GGGRPGAGRRREPHVLRAIGRMARTIVRGRCGGGGGGTRDEASPRRKGGGMIRRKWAGVLLVLALLGAACTGGGNEKGSPGQSGGVNQRGFRIVVVTHGQASDPFWSIVANGVEAAAADEAVTAEYRAPGTFDMVAMAQLIDAAVASKPDGLIVSIPDADALATGLASRPRSARSSWTTRAAARSRSRARSSRIPRSTGSSRWDRPPPRPPSRRCSRRASWGRSSWRRSTCRRTC